MPLCAALCTRGSAGTLAPVPPSWDSRSGCLPRCHLQTVQVIDGALRVGGGGEDRTLVLTQDFQPVCQVGGVVFARLGGDAEVRTQEGRPQLGHQFLAGIGVIAKAFASELPVEAALVLGPVAFMPTSA